jgi:hypothetical protein
VRSIPHARDESQALGKDASGEVGWSPRPQPPTYKFLIGKATIKPIGYKVYGEGGVPFNAGTGS